MSCANEIRSYIRLRDGFLAVAEEVLTMPRIERALIANDAVQSFLTPAPEGSVYGRYQLPDAEALQERQRCEAVKVRIEQLRQKVALNERIAA